MPDPKDHARPASGPAPPGRPELPRWRKWLYRLIAITAVPAAIVVLIEVGLRVGGFGYPTGFFTPVKEIDGYVTNPRFGWRFFPPAVARSPLVESVAAEKPPGTVRIFVLGGSAAMGYPEPAYSFGRVLQFMLSERFPDRRFEVINAAMVAINSHVVRLIAKDCARLDPDAFVVYLGNNEVVGPFGPGTVFAGFSPNLGTIRASLWTQSTRIGQLLGHVFGTIATRFGQIKTWRGMEMFLDKIVTADDPRLERVYEHLRANLEDICRAGQDAGAEVYLCTVPTDVKDTAPFASRHRPDLTPDRLARFEKGYDEGITLAKQASWKKARAKFESAAAIDSGFAALHYRLAATCRALGDVDEARRHYVKARDLDGLRFRADSRINGVIRQVAASHRIALIDAERSFGSSGTVGPGREYFLEHVHLNFAGNWELASNVYQTLAPRLIKRDDDRAVEPPPDRNRCVEGLAFTPWNRFTIAKRIVELTGQPPFPNQLDHQERQAERVRRRDAFKASLDREALGRCIRIFVRAIDARPDDPVLRKTFAELLMETGNAAGAAEQLVALLEKHPAHRKARNSLGLALAAQGRSAAARMHYLRALEIDPTFVEALNNLGLLEATEKNYAAAVDLYRRALAIKPNDASIHYNLGMALRSLDRLEEAVEAYRTALEYSPEFYRAHHNLANALQLQGSLEEAVGHYREAIRIKPDHAAAHLGLGLALLGLGRVDEAVANLESALKLEPGNESIRRNLERARAMKSKK
jgi:Flp pilus assembly protein TadD